MKNKNSLRTTSKSPTKFDLANNPVLQRIARHGISVTVTYGKKKSVHIPGVGSFTKVFDGKTYDLINSERLASHWTGSNVLGFPKRFSLHKTSEGYYFLVGEVLLIEMHSATAECGINPITADRAYDYLKEWQEIDLIQREFPNSAMAINVSLNKRIIQEAGSCRRLGYLRVRDRQPESETEQSADEEVRILYGIKVGQKAREQFPDGILIQSKTFAGAVVETKAVLLTNAKVIFEAAFSWGGIGIKVDVFIRKDSGGVDLIEVKSGTKPDEYYEDVSVQIYVLRKLGIQARSFLMILNKEATIKSKSLFQLIDCIDEVEKTLPTIKVRIEALRNSVLAGKSPEVPFTRACRECDYFVKCLPKLPEHHIFTLYRGGAKIDDLIEQDIYSLKKLPKDFKLADQQAVQVETIKSGKPWKSANLDKILKTSVKYPMFFLDFEAAADPIPEYDKQHPYDLLPFQWSCHLQVSPRAKPKHHEFLFDVAGDPRKAFADSLLECLGDSGTIVVYTGYEKRAIVALAKVLPSRREALLSLIPRLWDLCDVIQKHFYHPDFRGSFSIKKVLPVLVPSLSYDAMEISGGMAAVLAYYRLVSNQLSQEERRALRASLVEYCKLDTFAMLAVYEALQNL